MTVDYPYFTIRTKRPTDEYGVTLTFRLGADDDPTLASDVIQAIKDHFDSIPDRGVIYADKFEVTDSTF